MSDAQHDKTQNSLTKEQVIEVLRTVYDPEIPVSIYDLGLIYELKIDDTAVVNIQMTLTSPACPVAGALPREVESKVKSMEGVSDAKVELVWDPPWTPQMMTDAAKLQLNMDIPSAPPPGPQTSFDINIPRQ